MPATKSTIDPSPPHHKAVPRAAPRGRTPTATQAPDPAGSPGPLSGEHLQALADARVRAKKVRRAAGVATVSGWTVAFFALCTMLGAVFGDLASLAMGVGLGVVAFNELRGARMLRRFDASGARLLGYNQLLLAVLVVSYAGWSMWRELRAGLLSSHAESTGDPNTDALINSLRTSLTYGIYGLIAVAGLFGPGLTAWYYFTRAKLVRRVLAETPAWVIEALRAAG